MKKTVLTVVLSIWLTLATLSAVIFGWLYFANISKDIGDFNAKALVERVYEDFGFNKKGKVQTNSLEFEQFEGEDIMDAVWGNTEVQSLFNPWTAQLHLSIIKSAVNWVPENFDKDGIYTSQITYKSGTTYYKDEYFVKLDVTENSVIGSVWINQYQGESTTFTSPASGNGWTIKVQQTSDGGWKLNSYGYRGGLQTEMKSSADYFKTFGEYSATADSKGNIYQMKFAMTNYTTLESASAQPEITKENIANFALVEANTKTKQKIAIDKESLTDQESDLIEQAEKITNEVKEGLAGTPDFKEKSQYYDGFADNIFKDCFVDFGFTKE